jgi:hypothetical protein
MATQIYLSIINKKIFNRKTSHQKKYIKNKNHKKKLGGRMKEFEKL